MRVLLIFSLLIYLNQFSTAFAAETVPERIKDTFVMSKIDTYLSIIEIWKNKDIEGVLENLTDDVVWHYAAAIEPPLRGKQAARDWLGMFAGTLTNSRWRVISFAESKTQLFVEGIEEYDTRDGVRIVLPYSGIYYFREGKISGWRDYFERGLSVRTKEGRLLPDFVEELAARPHLGSGR